MICDYNKIFKLLLLPFLFEEQVSVQLECRRDLITVIGEYEHNPGYDEVNEKFKGKSWFNCITCIGKNCYGTTGLMDLEDYMPTTRFIHGLRVYVRKCLSYKEYMTYKKDNINVDNYVKKGCHVCMGIPMHCKDYRA